MGGKEEANRIRTAGGTLKQIIILNLCSAYRLSLEYVVIIARMDAGGILSYRDERFTVLPARPSFLLTVHVCMEQII